MNTRFCLFIFLTTLLLLIFVAGLSNVILPAFGHFPLLRPKDFNIQPGLQLWKTPELTQMLLITASTSIASTLLSVLIALSVITTLWGTHRWNKIRNWLAPMMSKSHAALAFGISFIVVPIGLTTRLLALIADWIMPTQWELTQDAYGLNRILLLIIK